MDLLTVISGPADPVFMAFLIPKRLQKILENIWEHLGKYYFSISENQTFRKVSKGKPTIFLKRVFLYIFFEYISSKWFYEDEELEMIHFFIIKQHPNWNLNFISIKKHETKFTLNFLMFKEGTLNFFIFKKGNQKNIN